MVTRADPGGELTDALARLLGPRWERPVRIEGLRRLSGGASRETWSFDAVTDGAEPVGLVLRRDPVAVPRPAEMAREAALFTAAARAGVPIPRLLEAGDGGGETGVGSPYLLMERLDGETIPRRLLREPRWADARAGLAGELGRVLARIHTIDPDEVPALEVGGGLDGLRAEHDAYGEPRPALELALRWLAEHRPVAAPARLVHGDFRNGNLLLGTDGLRAVLDWEIPHLGDPMEDLGWLCVKAWRFGSSAPVGGFGARDELLDGYAEVAGWRPDLAALHWWEVYGTVRWAVICRMQAQRHLGGEEPSVELAVLGRRICEPEFDVLLALGLAEPTSVPDPLEAADDPSPTPPHDRPSADELLTATTDFLTVELDPHDDRSRFLARVAGNALTIARRELRVGPAQQRAHAAGLAALGCADDRALVDAIRAGSLDERWDEVVHAVRAATLAKLAVANPRYASQPYA